MSDSEFTWNYRLINMPSANLGEDHLVLCEVHYVDAKPHGYSPVDRVMGDTLAGVKKELRWMALALKAPILHEDEVGRWDFQRGEMV